MNAVLLAIEIYLLIGLTAALVMARIDAREPCPMPWRGEKEMLAYASVTILFWLPLGWIALDEALKDYFHG